MQCPTCSTENQTGVKFCSECGAALSRAQSVKEERKVVTVLFADVVGFTSRSESLDVEDVGALLEPYHRLVATEVLRWGGTVTKFIGDGVMALFGAPNAHEDDPRRAVRAALAIQSELARQRNRGRHAEVHARIGITTGQVLLRMSGPGQTDAIGDVVNTAARLESAAPHDAVLVGERTYRATSDVIDYVESDPVRAKGKTELLAAFVAQGIREPTADGRSAAALVGRATELDALCSRIMEVSTTRRPALLLVTGVPGVGKSRLVEELRLRVTTGQAPVGWLQGRCPPYGEGAPFAAFSQMVRSLIGATDADSADVVLERLAGCMVEWLDDPAEAEWIMSQLRGPLGVRAAGDAKWNRDEAFAAWRRFIEAHARRGPTVLAFEDTHWADDLTLEFIDQLRSEGEGPIAVLCTSRPEIADGWPPGDACLIDLEPLTGQDTTALIGQLLGTGTIRAGLHEVIVGRAEGNPLFVHEYMRMLIDDGVLVQRDGEFNFERRGDTPLPETVQGVIAARLDALPPEERSLVIDASVIGSNFGDSELAHVSCRPAHEVIRSLARLEQKRFVDQHGPSHLEATTYVFGHALIRESAYELLTRPRRAQRHELAASWLEQTAADRDDRLQLIAHHYQQALTYRQRGGDVAATLVTRTMHATWAAGRHAASLGVYTTALPLLADAVALCSADDPERGTLLLDQGRALLEARMEGESALRESCALLERSGQREILAEARMLLAVLLYHGGDPEASESELRAAYESLHDEPPSQIKTEALGLVSRTALERGDGERSLRLAHEAIEAISCDTRADVAAYARRQLGIVEVACGHLDGLQKIGDSIPELERLRLLPAASAHRADLLGTQIELGQLTAAKATLAEIDVGGASAWARISEEDIGVARAFLAYWAGAWDTAAALIEPLRGTRSSSQAVVPQNALLAQIALGRGDSERADALSASALDAARAYTDIPALLTALVLRARVMVGRDQCEAAKLVREAADIWTERTAAFGTQLPVAAFVYARLDLAEEGHAAMAPVRIPTDWLTAARLLLCGNPLAAAAAYKRIGSLPDQADALMLAAQAAVTSGNASEVETALSASTALWRSINAPQFLREATALDPQLRLPPENMGEAWRY